MIVLHTVAETRAIEQSAMGSLPPRTLMERAGKAAAELALGMLLKNKQSASVLVLAGSGNNGGDAFETATHLAHAGAKVSVLSYAQAEKQPDDAKAALHIAHRSPARFRDVSSPEASLSAIRSTQWDLVIDGLFGIGLSKPITGDLETIINAVNTLTCPVLALDTPSGLNVDTGAISGGTDGIAIRATHTITFIAGKPGLYTLQGRDHAGEVTVASLDIDPQHYPARSCLLNEVALFSDALKPRLHDSHKGSYGNVAIVGGAQGMAGAVILAGRAALHAGAGRVYTVFLENTPRYDSIQPELMCRHAHDFDFSSAVLVVGPGLGQSRGAHDLLAKTLNARQPIVLDADAFNLIAAEPGLQQRVRNRREPTLMTPHPLEAARLLSISSNEVQANRIDAARKLANAFNATVILKGSGSIIAEPDVAGSKGMSYVNPTGNPALATAGTGDVLAGLCGALLAQGLLEKETALAATWLHGQAADELVRWGKGPIGLTANELMPVIRMLLNRIAANKTAHEK
ncbi:MAG: NAD(P)H-hydrate dehydratase [Oxalobacter sp.]|nr:MAG: NAD(P)H-hydrate dehydratase [Oxalobacter sp.]